MKQQCQPPLKTLLRDEHGAVAILMTAMLPVFVGFTTLAVDATYVYATHNQLQIAADAAALAGVQQVGFYTLTSSTPCTSNPTQPSQGSTVCTSAQTLATANRPHGAGNTTILQTTDIVVGVWDGSFTPLATGLAPNAVKATTSMTAANSNPLSLFFTPMLSIIANKAGFKNFSLTATAIAAYSGANAGGAVVPAHLIVVIDTSSSFQSNIANAVLAAQDCAKYFAQQNNANANFGVTLFTGNSPQTGWAPANWTSQDNKTYCSGSPNACTTPYMALTSPNPHPATFLTNANTQISNINTNKVDNAGVYQYSGSNVAAGMQSAINQLCPSGTCASGTTEMVIVTDGVPNCSTGGFGTSKIAGQNCIVSGKGANQGTEDQQLLTDAQTLATTAGTNGITVSTVYYSGETGQGNGGAIDPNSPTHQTYAQELESLTTKANAALTAKNPNATQGQFFNEPDATNLNADMQQICAAAASGNPNGNMPRLVQ
jgi:Flp pilus assembly protein TadG